MQYRPYTAWNAAASQLRRDGADCWCQKGFNSSMLALESHLFIDPMIHLSLSPCGIRDMCNICNFAH